MSYGGSFRSAYLPLKQVITGPAEAFSYIRTSGPATTPISLSELKSYLKITTSTDDTLLLLIIDLVTEVAEKIMRRDLISKTYTTYRDAISFTSKYLVLRRSKLLAVNYIKYIDINDVLITISPTIYSNTIEADYSKIFLNKNENWPSDVQDVPQAIQISFDAGYGTLSIDVPADIRGALLQHAALFYENRGDCACDGVGAELSLPSQSRKIYDLYKIRQVITMQNFF